MPEIYTCICGSQVFIIMGAKICCDGCGKEYSLMWLDDEMESPQDFNERIREGKREPIVIKNPVKPWPHNPTKIIEED